MVLFFNTNYPLVSNPQFLAQILLVVKKKERNGVFVHVRFFQQLLVGQMKGDLQDMETYSSSEEEKEEEEVKPKAGQSKQR